jgi:hypothetical protein
MTDPAYNYIDQVSSAAGYFAAAQPEPVSALQPLALEFKKAPERIRPRLVIPRVINRELLIGMSHNLF